MLRSISLFAALLFLIACGSENEKRGIISYCDTKLFMETEIQQLTTAQAGLQKNLEFNGNTQAVHMNKPNWTKELDAFLSVDLHKVNYKGRFDADTLVLGDTAYRIIYKANDDKLTLRTCSVTCTNINNRITAIEAFFDNRNSLYKSTKKLKYISGTGYRISGTQQVKLGNNISYEITGTFINP